MKINANGLVSDILEVYKVWCDTNLLKNEKKHYLMENSINGIPCFDYNDLFKINQFKNTTIIIDNLLESVHSQSFFLNYEKSNFYIIFSNGRWDKSAYSFENLNYENIYFPYGLYAYRQYYTRNNYIHSYLETQYDFNYPKEHLFVSLIGNERPERTLFSNLINESINPSKDVVLRYAGKDLRKDSSTYDIPIINFKTYGAYSAISGSSNSLEKYDYTVSGSIPINLYNSGYFNLIVETDIKWTDSFMVTEKTIKSLITGMPFVVASTPYFLSNLRKMGFLTYDTLWDESYDNETDMLSRFTKIVELCNSLESFDWVGNKEKLEYIALKNQQTFYTQTKIIDSCFNELEKTILRLESSI